MPNLLRAYELQKKAAKVGFDWQEITPALEKVKEELEEFEAELTEMSEQSELVRKRSLEIYCLPLSMLPDF